MKAEIIANLDQALKPVQGAAHLTQTISSTIIAGSSIASVHENAQYFYVQVELDAVRLTLNSTNPTSTVGFARAAGWEGILSRSEFLNARWLRQTTDARLQIAQLA